MYRVVKASTEESSSDIRSVIQELNTMEQFKGVSKVPYDDIKKWENTLNQLPEGVTILHPTDAGVNEYTKLQCNPYGDTWEVKYSAPSYVNKLSGFDLARYMAGSAFIQRGRFSCKQPKEG